MQFSIAQEVADHFVSLINDPATYLECVLGEGVWDKELNRTGPGYISDWLQIWLYSGLAHKACHKDVNTYIHAVALVFVEFSVNSNLFGGLAPVPPVPPRLVSAEDSTFVTSQQYLLPTSLTSEGFMATRKLSKEDRRVAVMNFFAHTERFRYGFDAYAYYLDR